MMQLLKRRGYFESTKITYLNVGDIVPNPSQPRKIFDPDGLRELSDSIAVHGVLQPLSVRRAGGRYELVAGERRLRAAKMAGVTEVPCILLGVDNEESSYIALIENLQRRDLDFLEEAQGLARLIALFGLSQEEAAQKIGKSQSAVANKLRLLKHSPEILELIRENGFTERHARALLRLVEDSDKLAVIRHIIKNSLNVTESEKYIDRYLTQRAEGIKPQSKIKALYIIKDIRLFINSLNRGIDMMKQSGVDAQYGKTETDKDITITIKIPKRA